MANPYFQFKQFTIYHDRCAMKVTTDACLFGAWVSGELAVGSRRMADGIREGNSADRRVLDLGAGTGLLSLMLAQMNTGLTIDAIEIDPEASQQAKENVERSPWKDRITVINDDARSSRFNKKYNYIISNPPFYENELHSPDQRKNTAHHSGGLGLQEVITIIKENLASDGWFFLLLPYKRTAAIKELLLQNELAVAKMIFVRQSVNHDYFRVMLMGQPGNNNANETIIEEISIMEKDNQYTAVFTGLLQPYYLYL